MPGPGFKETAFLYAVSSAALTHTLARACSAGRMERCTCDDSPGLESRQAWQWGVCGDNLKYSTKFLSNFLGPKRGSKDLRARVDAHNTHMGIKVSVLPEGLKALPQPGCRSGQQGQWEASIGPAPNTHAAVPGRTPFLPPACHYQVPGSREGSWTPPWARQQERARLGTGPS